MIVFPKRQVLLLYLKEPDRVLSIIPTARAVSFTGRRIVVVPHRLDEVRVLRNLGFAAPSPIKYYYPWPGRFTPFHAQKETAEFLTLQHNAFVLNDLGCVDADTEYLSPAGWRRIADYQGGEVAQYWPTGQMEFVQPTEFVKLPCPQMIRVKTKYGVDQLLSPEHRVLLHGYADPTKQEVVQAWELLRRHDVWFGGGKERKSRERIGYTQAAIPVTFTGPEGVGLPMSDEKLRVQVAVVADGHFPNRTNRCVIRLKRQRKKDRLRRLLCGAGIEFREREQNTATAQGFTVFTFAAPRRVKTFDADFWDCTREQLKIIADEVIHWDGSFRASKPTIEFSSRASADFVQYVFATLGRVARVLTQRRASGTDYTVIVRDNGRPLKLAGSGSAGPSRAMSIEPSTDGFKYCFMVPSTFLVLRRNGCIFCTGNTGKTLSVLWAYDYLRSIGTVQKALIVSSLSTLERVWGDEIFGNFPHLTFGVLHGTASRRLKMLDQEFDLYIINHDGIKTKGLHEALAVRDDINLVIVDEIAQAARNTHDRWKALNKICNKQVPRRVWGMTGKPTPNAPTDAWAQVRLIAPKNVPPYYNRFKDMVMRQVGPFTWLPRDNAIEIVKDAMQPAIRYSREQCHDLPPCIYQTRSVELTAQQKKAYKEMVNTLRTEVEAGEILAVNEAVKIGKLLQISCGTAYGATGDRIEIPATPRIAAVHEIVEEAEGKVIVFVPYVGALEKIAEELRRLLGSEEAVAAVHGGTSKHERDGIFRSFQAAVLPRVLVAQPASMAHGLTLTAASTIVWFSAITSNEIYEQANGRIVRPGQKNTQFIINIEGCAIERKLYQRLRDKQSLQGLLLEMVKAPDVVEAGV